MPGAVETVKLQVELFEKNAEARLKALDKLAREMGNRKITLNFDEASLERWKNATAGMTNAQINAYAKIVSAVEQTTQAEINAANRVQTEVVKAEAKKAVAVEQAEAKKVAAIKKTEQVTAAANAKEVAAKESAEAKKVAAKEKTAATEIAAEAKTTAAEIAANAKEAAAKESAEAKKVAAIEKTKRAQEGMNQFASTLTSHFSLQAIALGAIFSVVSKIKQAVREAVTEMKEMDKELTTIKMVTGASDADISALRQQAFQGARDAGRTTFDYLSASERFARAGYRENIKELTKLSLVTQNVGGVTEEVASKFILAADAAWKMGGSAEKLWAMLDGVTAIADQNATDLGKIAEGITVAGSAFANAGESAATFTAMLGITTASTQRSGSEMARGLRTILFRVRQVKAEFDDGEVVDAKAISNAAKALDSVGISVLDKTGDLKSMSEILTELSRKWGKLSKAEQSYLQNYLAGNRNGNVLFALMDNWEQYEKMLQQYEESSGTALEKNAIYTESWEAATNDLKTAWVSLLDTITDSGGIIQDTVKLLTLAIDKFNEFEKKRQKFLRENNMETFLGFTVYNSPNQYDNDFAEFRKNHPEKIDTYGGAYWGGAGTHFETPTMAAADKYQRDGEKLTKAIKGQTEAIVEHTESTEADTEAVEESTKAVEESTNAFDKQKDKINAVSKAIKKERDDTIKAVADIYKAMNDAAEKGYYGSTAYRNGIKLLFGTDSRDKIKKEAKEAVDTYVKEIEKGDYSKAAANLWRKVADEDGNIRDSAGNIIASMEQVGDEFVWTFDKTGQGVDNFLKAMEDATGIGAGFWAAMMESFGMYTDALDNWIGDNTDIETNFVANTDEATKATEGYIGVIESVPTEVTTTYHAKYETDGESGTSGTVPRHAKGKRNGYSGISVVNDEYPADGSKPELIISRSTGRAYIANGGKPALVNLRRDDIVLTASETRSAMGGIPAFADGKEEDPYDTQNIDSLLTQVTTPADTTNNGGNGGGKKKPNPEKAWEELKKLIDYLIEHAENDLKEKLKVLDQQLAALEAEWKAQKEANELADKQLAVDNALLDLQKAQTERTVRYYNEETQQWEWMADQGSVNDAQKAYEDANKELADYLAEQEYERKKEEIENRKNELQEQFDAMTDAWSEIVDAIEAPSGDLQQLLNTIMNNGSGTLLEQSGSIADLLNALSSGLFNSGYLDGLFKINGNTENSTTTADTTFDKGGFAYGRGFMRKGSETETVIGPDITSAILDPVKNERFSSFADSLRFMMGNESPIFKGQSNITNNNGGNYYVNGIKIGHDMAQMPFVEVMRTIAIHANETA